MGLTAIPLVYFGKAKQFIVAFVAKVIYCVKSPDCLQGDTEKILKGLGMGGFICQDFGDIIPRIYFCVYCT